MARVSIGLEEYQEGRLPAVCVLSGEPADDLLFYQTPVVQARNGSIGPLLAALERLVGIIGANRAYLGLAGRVPVSRRAYRALERSRRLWGAAVAAGGIALVAAAWTGAAWSPAAAALSFALVVVAAVRRMGWRRLLPRPSPGPGGAVVILDNVHPAFASAVSDRRASEPGTPSIG